MASGARVLIGIGAVLAAAGGATASLALAWMIEVGTCASGGTLFEPARECASNAAWRVGLLAAGIAVAALGVFLVVRGLGVPRRTLAPAVNVAVRIAILMLVPGLVVGAFSSRGIDGTARAGVLVAAAAIAFTGIASVWFTLRRYGGLRAVFAPERDVYGAPSS